MHINPVPASAISRESKYVSPSQIKVGQSASLKSTANPLGLCVYNKLHEPLGLNQGINRAISEGRNPKTYGVPNFASNNQQSQTQLKKLQEKYK